MTSIGISKAAPPRKATMYLLRQSDCLPPLNRHTVVGFAVPSVLDDLTRSLAPSAIHLDISDSSALSVRIHPHISRCSGALYATADELYPETTQASDCTNDSRHNNFHCQLC